MVEGKDIPQEKTGNTPVPLTAGEIAKVSFERALQSGSAGASAMVLEVLGLMWLRTTVNYQYRKGSSMTVALRALYKDGGVLRFYRGFSAAIIVRDLELCLDFEFSCII